MGCCVLTQEKIVIKSSEIPLSDQESSENENENDFQKNSINIVDPAKKIKSDKNFELIIQKEKNKTEKKNLKSMNMLKEISYNEVCDCTKYF